MQAQKKPELTGRDDPLCEKGFYALEPFGSERTIHPSPYQKQITNTPACSKGMTITLSRGW